jgi:hypothetical protein
VTASGFGVSAGSGASLGTGEHWKSHFVTGMLLVLSDLCCFASLSFISASTQAGIGAFQVDSFGFEHSKPAASSGFRASFAATSGTKWDGTGGFTPRT